MSLQFPCHWSISGIWSSVPVTLCPSCIPYIVVLLWGMAHLQAVFAPQFLSHCHMGTVKTPFLPESLQQLVLSLSWFFCPLGQGLSLGGTLSLPLPSINTSGPLGLRGLSFLGQGHPSTLVGVNVAVLLHYSFGSLWCIIMTW